VAVNRATFLAPTDEQAHEEGRPYVGSIVDFYLKLGLIDESLTFDRVSSAGCDIVLIGSPATCVAELRRYVAAGVNHFNFRVSMGDMPPEMTRRTVSLLGEEVIPSLLNRGNG
jgi:alkanesulfonate monooxygenase SsuD/methylene tetrahydromethanopterin reductase-like flavin-dependent oxidoreductase (luciferase family)